MKPDTSKIDSESLTDHWEPQYLCDLVVVYEDTTTRHRALQLCGHLAQQLQDDCDFQCSWWNLDQFDNPGLCQQAADATAKADMVMVSLRDDERLTAALDRWLKGWLSRRGDRQSALVVLLEEEGQPGDRTHLLQSQLQQAARQARMDFFVHAYESPEPRPPYSAESLANRAQTVTPMQKQLREQPSAIPRWGINE